MTAAARKAAAPKPVESDEPEVVESDDLEVAEESVPTFTVKAPLIAIKLGSQVFQYTVGDVLPSGVDKDTLDRLTARGLVAASE